MNKVNYQRVLDSIIDDIVKNQISCSRVYGVINPSLLMHSCCAPCSSYCLKYLSEYFSITVLYYNPNISPEDEYSKRVDEQKRLIEELKVKNKISFVEGKYEPLKFFEIVKGLEDLPEGSKRCFKCYEMRQREAALYASLHDFDYFTTTLSVSPHKNAQVLNEIGVKLEKEYGVKYLISDFKKKGGYQKSIQYSKDYCLYRQNYCGCIFSKKKQDRIGDYNG